MYSLSMTYLVACVIPFILFSASRLVFHPLRKYPGPLLARLTDAYAGYFAIKKCLHLTTYHNFQKYGPVIRQAPNRLVFNTLTALHDIYLNPRLTKGDAYRSSQLRAKYPSTINAIDRDQHRRKRKFIGQALTERSMRSFEPVMSEQINIFLKLLLQSSQKENAVNMSRQCQRLGVDIIGLLSFGHQFRTQTEDTSRFIPQVIDAMSWRINTYMHSPLLAYLENLLAILGKRQVIRFGNAVGDIIKARMAQEKDAHHDLYSIVADYIGKGQDGLYRGELWPEAILFIMAGGTTTATTMSAMFFYLSHNPVAYATLAAEIRSTFKSADDIHAGAALSRCQYLRACIDETLRMSPPSLAILWRQQEASDHEPFIVDGQIIPPGTQVGVSLYSLFHSEQYFPDSFTFKPERWLGSPTNSDGSAPGNEKASAATRKAFVPFSLGDRACAGKSMAYLEASLTLARVFWFFDFELAPNEAGDSSSRAEERSRDYGRDRPNEFQLDDIFVAGHDGPDLIFRTRDDYWKTLETD
ncbi:cytochrome P450 [Nemania abortiva]|nr:cytochrome P450 [Nemania abortiva]